MSTHLFQPRMPSVDRTHDQERVFAMAWRQAREPVSPRSRLAAGQRCVAIVTPGRLIHLVPAPPPGSVSPQQSASVSRLFPADRPLSISVIAYNHVDALLQDQSQCIPFLGMLVGLSYAGHNVIVFEGHADALEAGLRKADALIIDSAMLPHLPANWMEVAVRVMSPARRTLVHNRQGFALQAVIPSRLA